MCVLLIGGVSKVPLKTLTQLTSQRISPRKRKQLLGLPLSTCRQQLIMDQQTDTLVTSVF